MEMVNIITASPSAIPITEMRTMGREKRPPSLPPDNILFAMKNSVFMHSKDKRLFVGDFRSEKQKKILFLEDMSRSFVLTFILLFATVLLPAQKVHQVISEVKTSADLQTGADQTEKYIPLLKGRSVALVANQTSMI